MKSTRKIATNLRLEQSYPVAKSVIEQPTAVKFVCTRSLSARKKFYGRLPERFVYPENGDSLSFGSIPCCITRVSSSMFPLRALPNITLLGSFSSSLLKDFVLCFSTLDAAVPIMFSCPFFCLSIFSLFPGFPFTIVTSR